MANKSDASNDTFLCSTSRRLRFSSRLSGSCSPANLKFLRRNSRLQLDPRLRVRFGVLSVQLPEPVFFGEEVARFGHQSEHLRASLDFIEHVRSNRFRGFVRHFPELPKSAPEEGSFASTLLFGVQTVLSALRLFLPEDVHPDESFHQIVILFSDQNRQFSDFCQALLRRQGFFPCLQLP